MHGTKVITFLTLFAAVLLFTSAALSSGIDIAERNSPLSEHNRAAVAHDGNITSFIQPNGQAGAGYRCGTLPPTRMQAEEAQKANDELMKKQGPDALSCTVYVPVAFHILRYNDGVTGNVTDQQVYDQLEVLNNAYASTNFQFVLDSIGRVNNTTWSQLNSSSVESAVKQALAISPATTLNIYTCTGCQGYLGWSYLPNSFPENNYMHGVVALYSSFPGGSAYPYNEGDTITHEAGHYLGLYHTFQGGCTAPGDYINDTPYEKSAAFGCPAGRDTCTSPGQDPIYNFMDYTEDSCMDHFTTDQGARIGNMVELYKPSLISCGAPIPEIEANGSGAPITISTTDTLSVVVNLDPQERSGDNADWWAEAETPFGWYHYDVGNSSWMPGLTVTYQGPLFNLAPYQILNMSGLPVGAYTFYFGVDMNMNGNLDMGQIYLDSVEVNIYHPTSTPYKY